MDQITYLNSFTDKVPKSKSWEQIVNLIRGNLLHGTTHQYRTLLAAFDQASAAGNEKQAADIKAQMSRVKCTQLPAIVCQATLEGGKDKECLRGYTGFLMVDFDHVPSDRLAATYNIVAADPHTFLAYTTVSGHGFRVIARVEETVTETNYRVAWLSVNAYYKRLTGLDYDTQCSNATRLCGLACDPAAIYQPEAQCIQLDASLVSQPKRKRTGRPAKAASLGKRVRQLVEADGVTYTDGHHNDYVSRCVYLMNRYGIQLNDCLDWTLHEFADYAARHSGTVEGIVQSVYERHANEHATLATHTRKATNKASVSEVERYMNEHCQVKRNLLSYKLESDGKIVDDHFVNSLWRRMQLEGINADLQTINSILGSDYVQDYHPFRQWIESLPPWDGTTDYIRQFFSMVHCTGTTDEVFHFYTRCWFLAMVASVIDDSQVNHEILTFIGRQGTYKSSFMLHILPPHLRGYFTTKNNSYQLTKDDHLMLAQNIIISLEEIDSMTTKEINQLKAFTTMPHINERPPYARHTVLMPRVASLTATGNNVTFLTDQTGNRRWLPFQVERIDNPWQADIPYEGMYAQALTLVRNGERFWLSDDDIRRLNDHNRTFLAPDPAQEMIVTFFRKPRTEAETKYMTATKIAAKFAMYIKLNPTKIGAALTELGYEQIRTHRGRFWKVAERPVCDIDSHLPDEDPNEEKEADLPF